MEYFPRIQYVAAQRKSQKFTVQMRKTPEIFTRRILFMSMFNDISCGTKDNEEQCLANARLVSLFARRFGKGQWSFIGCKWEVIVQGDEGPVGGVAQVVCHGVIVVVGHQEEGQEEEGEKQGEAEGEVEELKDNRTSWMIWRWGDKRVNGLEPCGV